jgi:hypothetical protein
VHNPSSSRFAAIFAVAAVLLLPLTVYAQDLMEFIFLRVEDPRYGSLLASIVLFGLPTVILGMISPYSVRLLVENVAESGRIAGALYFVSTLGSAIGTLMTSFYFVLWFEMNTIILLLIGCLALLATLAFTADKTFNK